MMATEGEICAPIDTLEEFWKYLNDLPKWAKYTVPISKRSSVIKNKDICTKEHACHYAKGRKEVSQRHQFGTLPKTLVCHDMKNGYQEDRFVDGAEDYSAYLFYHWAAIDMFVYFSHHFITIPPLGWINIAHKHGVQILGTIITEWKEGFKICEEIFASEEIMMKFINNIVVISKHFNLDGWLINIENKVQDPQMLAKFVKTLTEELHNIIPGSVVIWYDSVINTGKLDWQNCLNEKNKVYFDACDGLFTNYCWDKSLLESSAMLAGERKHDVYVGVDVWGRNFWGGGCFNTADAVKEIFNSNLSMAIFAPAWTHEAINTNDMQHSGNKEYLDKIKENPELSIYKCQVKDLFLLRESALWHTLWPYLNSRGPVELPFHSFFCLGSGEKRKYNGEVINKNIWYNLRDQQYQPSYPMCYDNFALELIPQPVIKKESKNSNALLIPTDDDTESETDNLIEKTSAAVCEAPRNKPRIKKFAIKRNEEKLGCSSYYINDCYYGGSCLKISPLKTHENNISYKIITRLFMCEFHCDFNFIIYYIVKPLNDNNKEQDLNLHLTLQHRKSKEVRNYILCDKSDKDDITDKNKQLILFPLNDTEEFEEFVKNLKTLHPGFYLSPENNEGWKIRYYSVKFPNSTLLQIDCELVNETDPMLLGGVGVAKDILSF